MKIVSLTVRPEQAAGSSASSNIHTSDSFHQLLRDMEKGMWDGARPGRMTGDTLPSTTRRVADIRNSQQANTPDGKPPANPDVTRSNTTLCSDVTPPGRAPASRIATSSSFEPIRRTPALALPPVVATTSVFLTVPSSQHSRERVTASAEPRRDDSVFIPSSPQPDSVTVAGNGAPFRVTVMNGTYGPSVAIRLYGSSCDDIDALSEHALAELRRQGITDARIVVNGTALAQSASPGANHGH
ncbi:hypothetical protein [Burkholderia cepacia]|uniref:Uncharacterized protein n=1 Tax=Burkholderia cepacia TaxID=292 RepID=A0AA88Z117_BURCE|nr:hypothetical protein [Burkholderia cepacia]KGB98461.1 hypothetical protein DM43_3074 [Burkholderia cepacia]